MTMTSTPLASDYSAISMSILSEKVRAFFETTYPEARVWMTDIYEWPDFPREEIVDVVVFGDFFRKFLESGNWIHAGYRFWGLGSPMKLFYTDLAGFQEKQVSLIPRHFLYQAISAEKPGADFHLVYAGRLSPSKRILTLIWTTWYLQTKWKRATGLDLYGEFIQEEKFCACDGKNPYRDEVLGLLQNLDWSVRPEYHGQVPPDAWTKTSAKNPTYISLSVLPFEDFSVSVAQAQEQGWPCILSQWGAHKDIQGTTLKIPLPLLESLTETSSSAERDGAVIADYIAKKGFEVTTDEKLSPLRPYVISAQELDEHRKRFLQTWGMNLQDVIRHRTSDLRQSTNWAKFMEQYLRCFK